MGRASAGTAVVRGRRYKERGMMVFLVVLVVCIVLPHASTFGVGTHATSSPVSSIHANKRPVYYPSSPSSTSLLSATADKSTLVSHHDEPTKTLFQRNVPSTEVMNNGNATMDQPLKGEYNASLPSRLLYAYASPLLERASKRQLESSDAFPIPNHFKMGSVVPKLELIYDKCRSKAKRKLDERQAKEGDESETVKASRSLTLAKSLLLHQRSTLLYTGILRFVNTCIQAFPALLVSRLLRLVESGESVHVMKPLRAAVALVAVLSVKMIVENLYFHAVVKYATQVRGSLAGLIFDKSLRLSSGSGTAPLSADDKRDGNTAGKALGAGGVLNLMQSDTSILENTALQIHTIWDGPLQIAIYTSLLFKYLGRSVIWGIAVLLMTIPMNSIFLRVLNRLSKLENEAKDSRTKRTAEAISNMKLLKLQAWENTFAEGIQTHRSEELRRHIDRGAVRALNSAISNAVPALVLVVTLTAYTKTGKPIVASTIFTAISLFNQLRFPLFFYPMLIDSLANGKNALRRVATYLSAEEINPYVLKLPTVGDEGGSVTMNNGNFLWSASGKATNDQMKGPGSAPALCGAELDVKPGEVVAVVGAVGSGKTAIIKALLGELAPVPRMVVDPSSAPLQKLASFMNPSNSTMESPEIMDVPSVVTHGSICYCAQEAWLPKGTIRDAVVFGREYDEERYLAAIYDAGLDGDMVEEKITGVSSKAAASSGILTHETNVGEGGSSLSGGQRARVALARALYDDQAGVFLLDDPLSALDASVGSMVFERITARLKRSKSATVLVTNDPSLPRRCDRVILMGKSDESSNSCSRIIAVGTYDELLAKGHDLRNIASDQNQMKTDLNEDVDDAIIESSEIDSTAAPDVMITSNQTPDPIRIIGGHDGSANDTVTSCHADPDCIVEVEKDPNYSADQKIPISREQNNGDHIMLPQGANDTRAAVHETEVTMNKLTSADDAMYTGAVPKETYINYLKAVRNPFLIGSMLASFLLANGAQFFQQYIVAKWTEVGSGDAMAVALGAKYLNSLVNAAGVVSVFLWIRSYLTMRVGVRASEFLHKKMLTSVFKAPMAFFDATPSGQLLSRFGKEMETVDRSLPDGIGSVLFCFLQIGLSTLALAGVVTPAMVFPLFGIGVLYYKAMSKFRPAARDMKRCESKSRAPIYTHFGEALRGVETIRSIQNGRNDWSSKHRSLSDDNLSVFSSVKALDRWLSIRLESLGNIVVFISALASIFLTRAGRLKVGSAGWGLTQALSITGLLTWAVRCLTDLETQMMSVSRITELTDLDSTEVKGKLPKSVDSKIVPLPKMPKENENVGEAFEKELANLNVSAAPRRDDPLVKSGWPWKGGIQFKNVSMRYNPISPLVLKQVTITIPPGTTLGVVGRTGSGKSSLLLTLFRLAEIEGGGSITIDGVDIRSVGLHTLRESLSIIPQDPVLFAGSVMYNLDATGKASKEDAWEALEAASPQLARQFHNAGTGLETHITEGGKNLSLGQRQLICLARALLKKSKILVLDEATSSVDSKTDAQVQDTIRREFVDKGVTVMTVAHRLDTVLGYDKIAVLGSGNLTEYGSPSELLRNPKGELRRLVDADTQNKRKGAQAKQEVALTA